MLGVADREMSQKKVPLDAFLLPLCLSSLTALGQARATLGLLHSAVDVRADARLSVQQMEWLLTELSHVPCTSPLHSASVHHSQLTVIAFFCSKLVSKRLLPTYLVQVRTGERWVFLRGQY